MADRAGHHSTPAPTSHGARPRSRPTLPVRARPEPSVPSDPADDTSRAPSAALLFEVAWEVCNQLGGIYQVIRSKAPSMVERWKDRYYLVGTYNPDKAPLEFEPRTPRGWLARTLRDLAERPEAEGGGIMVHCGRWLIPGRPKVLLIEYPMPGWRLDALKFQLWERHGIPAPGGDWMIDGVFKLADGVTALLRSAAAHWLGPAALPADDDLDDPAPPPVLLSAPPLADPSLNAGSPPAPSPRRLIAHFHEWMGGLALPFMLDKARAGDPIPVATVFTTHATQLGRTIAWGDEHFYDHLPFLDHAAEADKFNVRCQHGVERACAHACHVFTTVSPITGEECHHLLGRPPDMVLPNGLNIENYNVGHEFQTLHAQHKERIHRFSMGHFFPSYAFDLNKTLYFFTSGRFEPRNKGFDLCLEALARLNAELRSARAAGLDRTVVFFIITQRATRSLNPDVLHRRGLLNELESVCGHITDELAGQLFRRAAARQPIRYEDMVSDYWNLRFRRTQHAFRTDRLPPVVTHLLADEAGDAVLHQIRNVWLFNRDDDPVKIVYHPEFISPTNPLWGLEYDQFVRGCHMGVFPSAYEPWGYTPLECLAMGVPAVTSDLAGFGRYVEQTLPDLEGKGVYVLKRRGRSFNEAAADLARYLFDFCKLDRRERILLRNQVEHRSWEFDWTLLGQAYEWAHDLAMARAGAASRPNQPSLPYQPSRESQ